MVGRGSRGAAARGRRLPSSCDAPIIRCAVAHHQASCSLARECSFEPWHAALAFASWGRLGWPCIIIYLPHLCPGADIDGLALLYIFPICVLGQTWMALHYYIFSPFFSTRNPCCTVERIKHAQFCVLTPRNFTSTPALVSSSPLHTTHHVPTQRRSLSLLHQMLV
jgi:hypothetical protein